MSFRALLEKGKNSKSQDLILLLNFFVESVRKKILVKVLWKT